MLAQAQGELDVPRGQQCDRVNVFTQSCTVTVLRSGDHSCQPTTGILRGVLSGAEERVLC